jgi:hypothetical protein
VFARAGALLPVSEADGGSERRVLLVFGAPAAKSTAELYEDDGDMASWRSGGLVVRFERHGATLTMTTTGAFRPAFDRIAARVLGSERVDVQRAAGSIALVGE